MKTSTLRKLPIPFVIACVLGIGVLGFLLLSPVGQQQAAQNGVTPTVTNSRLPANSPRYRSKSGVAKLNRSSGTSSQASKQSGAEAQSSQTSLTRREATRQEIARLKAQREEAERQEANRLAQADREAALRLAARNEASRREAARREIARNESTRGDDARGEATRSEQAEAPSVAASTQPLRRDADQVKSTTVASKSEPASSGTYSTENPDPSELLSQVLGSDAKAAPQLEIDEPDTVMPPGIELDKVDLDAPKTGAAEMASNTESSEQVGETKTVAADEHMEASSVINGELTSETEPQSVEPAPKRVVRIINPLSNPLPVWFVTQKHKVKLKPGQRYETSTDDELSVRFARGGDLGVDRVVANDGDWVFSVTRQDGWKLSQN